MVDYEQLHLTDLAVLCQEVADNPSAEAQTAEKVLTLKVEWATLQETPRCSFKEQKELERQQAALKRRMIEFIRSI
jgi:hypothetical protein